MTLIIVAHHDPPAFPPLVGFFRGQPAPIPSVAIRQLVTGAPSHGLSPRRERLCPSAEDCITLTHQDEKGEGACGIIAITEAGILS